MSKILYDWDHVYPIVCQLAKAGFIEKPEILTREILDENARYFFGFSSFFRKRDSFSSSWSTQDLQDLRKIYYGDFIKQSLYDEMLEIAENCGFELGQAKNRNLRYKWLKIAAEWQLEYQSQQSIEEILLISSVEIRLVREQAYFITDGADLASKALNRTVCPFKSEQFNKLLKCAFELERILDLGVFLKFFQLLRLRKRIKLVIG